MISFMGIAKTRPSGEIAGKRAIDPLSFRTTARQDLETTSQVRTASTSVESKSSPPELKVSPSTVRR